jgi:hypothetical protein
VKTGFGAFYAELFDDTIRKTQNGRAVVTEYAWDTPILHREPAVSWQSYHCDPCPPPVEPPPTISDWVTLGDEAILGPLANAQGKQQMTAPLPPGVPETWVLTRLHTRYDKASLSEDLVFHAAKPMIGGTSNGDGTNADQGATNSPDGHNRFQGRYIIRHYWEGPVSCESPRYGIWTGPPSNQSGYRATPGVPLGSGAPQTAGDLANAKRGQFDLAKVVRSSRPPLRKKEAPAPPR